MSGDNNEGPFWTRVAKIAQTAKSHPEWPKFVLNIPNIAEIQLKETMESMTTRQRSFIIIITITIIINIIISTIIVTIIIIMTTVIIGAAPRRQPKLSHISKPKPTPAYHGMMMIMMIMMTAYWWWWWLHIGDDDDNCMMMIWIVMVRLIWFWMMKISFFSPLDGDGDIDLILDDDEDGGRRWRHLLSFPELSLGAHFVDHHFSSLCFV